MVRNKLRSSMTPGGARGVQGLRVNLSSSSSLRRASRLNTISTSQGKSSCTVKIYNHTWSMPQEQDVRFICADALFYVQS
ncbi:hypothetical protein L798_11012 [Zootermopsis nevadensis]|uniref:Uncharacterized protein n=1 Tax=Zootermopsis nevadensis TaxID=136037 RepID=A0A067QZF0_ZOONE|nr:hypothetical protein L798_11012 [Zootermopsis nevadensis]